ncbi:hypothetical protein F3Y22_tig00110328pilonHSYRG01221 [Hibiscus syriacus]|uniref:NAC domain-containing protein n=1 Tax=Hibiscus syriacus TaxID=106335 RepID=A0A6A3B1K3_HIBSY|nr:hypothetical protein F3Y22_tig00110328pilonHSYRG01221 [Hibiscus syriacus]
MSELKVSMEGQNFAVNGGVKMPLTDPWSQPGDVKENKYFFSRRHGNDSNKNARNSGYWKAIGKEKPILASGPIECSAGKAWGMAEFQGDSKEEKSPHHQARVKLLRCVPVVIR